MEKWKEIKDFENYWVSTEGRVWSEKRNKFIKAHANTKGYLRVGLYQNGKRYWHSIHRLVAQAFIENPENKPQIDHINAIRADNRVENLRWCTAKENVNFKSKESLAKGRENGIRYCGKPIIEKINDELSIAYPSLHTVPGIDQRSLSKHTSKGEVEFICKGRTFICPSNVLQ